MIEEYFGMGIRFQAAEIDHPSSEEYAYNPDGTLFECTTWLDKSKDGIQRHFYKKD